MSTADRLASAAAVMGRKGGAARAKNLTPERIAEISRKAAAARWEGHVKPIKATHCGTIAIGDAALECAVLEDGRRVVSERAFVRALGRARPGGQTYERRGGDQTPIYLALRCLKSFIPRDFLVATIPYLPVGDAAKTGTLALGVDATLVPRICKVWVDAWRAGALRADQIATALRAEMLRDGFAEVGIIALVDEATGFQRERAADALAQILEAFIGKELAKWAKTFDDDYYRELCRLKGLRYDELGSSRPGCIGTITNNIVYDRLAPGVLEKLRAVNPRLESGRFRDRHHQWLTRDTGYHELRQHLAKVILLMQLCATWEEFMTVLDERMPKWGSTLRIPGLPMTRPSRLAAGEP